MEGNQPVVAIGDDGIGAADTAGDPDRPIGQRAVVEQVSDTQLTSRGEAAGKPRLGAGEANDRRAKDRSRESGDGEEDGWGNRHRPPIITR